MFPGLWLDNMTADIKIIKDALSDDLRVKLNDLTRDGRQPSSTNFFHYPADVVGVSNAIFKFDLEEEMRDQLADELITKELLPNKPKNWCAHVNLFSRGAFIPWHTDSEHAYTITIYLNKKWVYDWGGALLYAPDSPPFKNISCIYPELNTGIAYTPPVWHTTTLTAINAPMRESLQIFVSEF